MRKLMMTAAVVLALPGLATAGDEPLPPADLVPLTVGDQVDLVWPYTGRDYSGTPTDPINIVFTGNADPRMIRQALLALDGNREPYFPNQFPFNCTWTDAIGSPQTSYSASAGWQGSAVQLECGDYALLRTHLRLFRHGPYTLGAAHFETQVPGTSSHQVLSWEVPEALVRLDLLRSGLAAPRDSTGPITDQPTYRTILPAIFSQLPQELRDALSLEDNGGNPVPIPNDGVAQVLAIGGTFEPTKSEVKVEFDHPFGQGIPKPFCSNGELVYVSGALHMVHQVKTDEHGQYLARFQASGTLQVVPIDSQGQPIGAPYAARVLEIHRSRLTDRHQAASLKSLQVLLTNPAEWLSEKLWAGRRNAYARKESCSF